MDKTNPLFFFLEDTIDAIQRLHKQGIATVMITGDNRRTAEAIARQVGIDQMLAEILSQDKAAEVERLQAQGKKAAMAGDCVNVAPGLARADVGIAISPMTVTLNTLILKGFLHSIHREGESHPN